MLETLTPGIWTWESKDVKKFRAFAVSADGEVVLIDPVELDGEEARAVEGLGKVVAILLTSSWHEREAAALAKRYQVPVYAHSEALAGLDGKDAQPLPEALPLGLAAWHVPGALPGQVAFYWERDGGSLITGDCWMNLPLREMPLPIRLVLKHVVKLRDGLHLIPPSKAKDSGAVIAAYREHLEQPLERLLVSHGQPILSGARQAMLTRLEQGI